MSCLQVLRNAHVLTRLVLVWLALFIGAAVATPWLKSPSVEMVCSGMGGTKMVQTDAGDAPSLLGDASLDCPAFAFDCPDCGDIGDRSFPGRTVAGSFAAVRRTSEQSAGAALAGPRPSCLSLIHI